MSGLMDEKAVETALKGREVRRRRLAAKFDYRLLRFAASRQMEDPTIVLGRKVFEVRW